MLDELLVGLLPVLSEMDPAGEAESRVGQFRVLPRLEMCGSLGHGDRTLATKRRRRNLRAVDFRKFRKRGVDITFTRIRSPSAALGSIWPAPAALESPRAPDPAERGDHPPAGARDRPSAGGRKRRLCGAGGAD